MQTLECKNLKELLDSYLGDELSVETNHAVLRHLEQCPSCRNEMAARRNLRATMRRAGTQLRMSAEMTARLRESLRTDTFAPQADETAAMTPPRRQSFFRRWLGLSFGSYRLPVPVAAMVILLLAAGVGIFLFQPQPAAAAHLSQDLWREAAGDHEYCAAHFKDQKTPLVKEEVLREYDQSYAGLDRIAETGAQGLRLRAAHICGFADRSFAHLVYTRGEDLISLLVTERNAQAMQNGIVPEDDGLAAGLQHAIQGSFSVSALQTPGHIVLVVTKLPQQETARLAAQIALPVSNHLRHIAAQAK